VNQINPYSAPSSIPEQATPTPDFDADQLPFVLKTPKGHLVFYTFMAMILASLSVGGFLSINWIDGEPYVQMAIAVLFGLAALAFASAHVTTTTIDDVGIRTRGIRRFNYQWKDLLTWYLDERCGLITLVHHNGKRIVLASFAMAESRNAHVTKAITYFLGPQAELQHPEEDQTDT